MRAIRSSAERGIVGAKMRRILEVRDEVMARAGRYRVVKDNLHVKEVWVDDRRYVICFNPEEARKDQQDREKIVTALSKKLGDGGIKRLIPNRGFRRFLRVSKGEYEIDQRAIEEETRFDGKYVLRTTTDLPADEVALAYKNLLWIERLFRDLKDLLETRPIYHHWVTCTGRPNTAVVSGMCSSNTRPNRCRRFRSDRASSSRRRRARSLTSPTRSSSSAIFDRPRIWTWSAAKSESIGGL
jgi:hypothetical protein